MRRGAGVFLMQDAIFIAVFCLICGGAATLLALAHPYLLGTLSAPWAFLLLPTYAVLYILAMCAIIFAIRIGTGRLKAGSFDVPGSSNAARWMLHLAMLRLLHFPAWRFLVYGITTLRFLAFRALGCRNAFASDASADATVLDVALHEIGAGSMLASGVVVTGHFMNEGKLVLSPVRIGSDTMILTGAQLGPGTEIGPRVSIGPMTMISGHLQIAAGAKIGPQCTLRGGVRVEEEATIEESVYLESKVEVGKGARVLAHTRVPKGTIIEPGATYP